MTNQQTSNFASDNNAGMCPEAIEAIMEANQSHAPAYGTDRWTHEACDLFRDLFDTDCEIFFVFNGTAANSLSMASLCRSYHSVICHSLAHIETDECGAPEFFSGGSKILTSEGNLGKLMPNDVETIVHRRKDIHYPKPKVLSLTQSTEVGTIYSKDHLAELGAIAHGLNLKIHMDGARFANAVAALGCAPKDISWKAGVDVLCFGGTKNGMPLGEAVVFFNKELAHEFEYRCKQAGQLCSKMRYLSAPWVKMLKNNTWLKYARNANERATELAHAIETLNHPEIRLIYPSDANAVFVQMPQPVISHLYSKGWTFYDFIAAGGCRLMCSWDTTSETVNAFINDLKTALASEGSLAQDYPVMKH